MDLSNAERLAVAVLKGDKSAIPPLIDAASEELGVMPQPVPTNVTRITVNRERLRAVFATYPQLGGDVDINHYQLMTDFQNWLDGVTPVLAISGGTMTLYELPEKFDRAGE